MRTKLVAVLLLAAGGLLAQKRYEPNWESLDTRTTPAWFEDAKFGIFIHWGVYSVPAYAPVLPNDLAYAEWYWHQITEGRKPGAKPVDAGSWAFHKRVYGPNYDYRNFAGQFRAELFDPDHWAQVFQDSGARYVALTSKHHEGFALWPSKEASATWGRPWNAVEVGPHRDLLGDLSAAVRKTNVRMGYYYSLYEWYNPLYLRDKAAYVAKHMHPQFKDLVSRYKPDIIFSDGEWEMPSSEWRSPELLAWLYDDSPVKDYVVVDDRWGKDTRHKHGGYWTTEYTAGMESSDHPWEESRGMGFSYGYNRDEQLKDYHTGRQLVLMLVDLVSRGGNFLLDIGPNADGRIPVVMEQRLEEIGRWMRVNGEAIYGTKPWHQTRQWSDGAQPSGAFNKEFKSEYDVSKLVEPQGAGKASIEAFFTSKGATIYVILPHWNSKQFVLKSVANMSIKSARLLGGIGTVGYTKRGDTITFDLPALPEPLFNQPAWVIKLEG